MTIYEKILEIMKDVQRLQKDDLVEYGSQKYKALSEEKVTTIMRAELIKYGLIVYPIKQVTTRTGNITHIDTVYRMVNAETPDEYIEIASAGDGSDTQDKGSGKAQTYAYKYMWLRTFALPTGEDPDKVSSAELDARDAELDMGLRCSACGELMEPIRRKDGSPWSPAQQADYSTKRFGRVLCPACMTLARRAKSDGA